MTSLLSISIRPSLSQPVFELDNILDTPQLDLSILDRIEAVNCQNEDDDISPSLLQVSVCDRAFDSQLSLFDCKSQPDITSSNGVTDSNKHISDSEPVYPEKTNAKMSKKLRNRTIYFNFQDQYDFDNNPLNPIITLDARLTELSKMITNYSNNVICQSILTFDCDLKKYVNIVTDGFRTLKQQLILARSDPASEFELHNKIKLNVIQLKRIIPIVRRSKQLLRLVSQHQNNISMTSTVSQTQEGSLNPTVAMEPVVELVDTGCQADRLTSGERDVPKCKIESIPTVSQLISENLIKIGSEVLSYEYLGFKRLASIVAKDKIKCSANNRVYSNEVTWINSFLVGSVKNIDVYEKLKYKDENWNQFEMFVGVRQKENETSETIDLNDCSSVKSRVAPEMAFLLNSNLKYWPAMFERILK